VQEAGENYSDTDHTVPELLNRFVADGWEQASLRDYREGGDGSPFLESARRDLDPLYAAYVLILVLGLRRGEALGLTWRDIDFDASEVHIRWQLQRAGHQLRHRETKTPGSAAVLPLPDICLAALKLRAERQAADKKQSSGCLARPRVGFHRYLRHAL
jgi:integrase